MGDICNICGEPCSSVPWIHDRCYEAMLVELSELRAELDGQITGTWQPVMPGYNMMIHLNHPCVGWDILVTPIKDEDILRGQGYISIAEVIGLAQGADKMSAALKAVSVIRIVAHGEPYCPWCGFMKIEDKAYYKIAVHAPDCQRQAALKGE